MSCSRTQCSVSGEAFFGLFLWLYSAGEFTVTIFRNGNSRTFVYTNAQSLSGSHLSWSNLFLRDNHIDYYWYVPCNNCTNSNGIMARVSPDLTPCQGLDAKS